MKAAIARLGRVLIGRAFKILSLLLAGSLLAFALISFSPADPVQQYILSIGPVSAQQRAEIEAYWGVGQAPALRYVHWLGAVLRGDLGQSALYRRPVAAVIGERFAASLALMLCAWVLAGLMGFALGCLMGLYQGRWPDRLLKKLCYVISGTPTFWLGLLLLLVFAVRLGWFPVGFSAPIGVQAADVTLWQRLHHLALPAFTLSLAGFAGIALHTRQKLIDVLSSDYVLFARARGEGRWTVLYRHGLRNILLPALSLQFASFAELFGGSVLAETVFSYPGLGSAAAAAGLGGDVPLLLGITLFSAVFVCTGNLIADLLYAAVDPRIGGVAP